jgi:hypothetical protein
VVPEVVSEISAVFVQGHNLPERIRTMVLEGVNGRRWGIFPTDSTVSLHSTYLRSASQIEYDDMKSYYAPNADKMNTENARLNALESAQPLLEVCGVKGTCWASLAGSKPTCFIRSMSGHPQLVR